VAWARQTLAMMSGLQVQWLLDPSVDMAGLFRAHVDRFRVVPDS
jgi:hypothetical protein